MEIIQKNLDPNEDSPEDLSAIASKFEIKKLEICSAPKCEIPTVPKAIERTIIKSVRFGILAVLFVKEDTFSFNSSMADYIKQFVVCGFFISRTVHTTQVSQCESSAVASYERSRASKDLYQVSSGHHIIAIALIGRPTVQRC